MQVHVATAELKRPDPAELLARIDRALTEDDLPTWRDASGRLRSDTGIGALQFDCAGDTLRIEIRTNCPSNLYMLREGVAARLDRLDGGSHGLTWAGTTPVGQVPPNFRAARVSGTRRIGARFVRLTLEAEDLQPFARSGLHLRLLIPPQGRVPVWPVIGANGRTVWPEGEDALHTPAYTIRRVDAAAGRMEIDIFAHGHGPTCRWAERARPGDVIGLSGPGGGWLPDADALVIAGDETALPAIARILEALPDHVRGHALIAVADAGDRHALAAPPGMRIDWLHGAGADLVPAFKALPLPGGARRHAWFAAEKAQATAIRRYLRNDLGWDRRDCHVAAYWVQS